MTTIADRTVITSALPYIHGVPHLGNIVGSILPADVVHRYMDVRGEDNIFICGSDEHGTPLELAAMEADRGPREHADIQHRKVKDVLERFDMDFTLYGRTHTQYNREQTHEMFRELYNNGYITEEEQELPYCNDCERFLPDRYIEGECPHCGGLARGDQCDETDCGKLLEPEEIIEPYCTICDGRNIEFRTTKNLFLDLPAFEDQLKEWLKTNEPIPDNQKAEVLNLIDDGLEQRCITRDIAWGFDVPTEGLEGLDDDIYDDKVLYVWFDAPIGYIGITRQYFASQDDEARWEEYWKGADSSTMYSIGKDNTIFHTVIWPSILLGQHDEYRMPDYEFIHQYLLSEDVQFSKSRGTGLTSEKALDLLPSDYWRYYLVSVLPLGHDASFSWDDLEARINGELNDTVGNYANRVLSLAEKWFDGRVPEPDNLNEQAREFLAGEDGVHDLLDEIEHAVEQDRDIRKALGSAVGIARRGDEFLSDTEPWKHEAVQEDVIYACLVSLKALAVGMYPVTPAAARRLNGMIDPGTELIDSSDQLVAAKDIHALEQGAELGEREILFEKVDADELQDQLDDDTDTDEEDDTMTEDTISFDQFQDLDMRTATIVDVEDHPNADKLYLLQVDFGDTTKQSCAGLKPHFEPEELEGRSVIAVYNLESAELRGERSETMVLAVETDDGDVVTLTTSEDVPDGLEVH